MRINRKRIIKIKIRRISRNTRTSKKNNRITFGIKVPNSVKEALLFDRENNNTLWSEAIMKETTALQKAGVWEFYPPHSRPKEGYQYAPLKLIFDVKREDLRRKVRMVAGGHVIESSMFEKYLSVVQTRTIRILETIAINEGLKLITGDIGNAFIYANTEGKYIQGLSKNSETKRVI